MESLKTGIMIGMYRKRKMGGEFGEEGWYKGGERENLDYY